MPAALLGVTADPWASAASATWQTVTGLTFTIPTGGINVPYYFDFTLMVWAAATTTGHQVGITGPAAPTYLRYSWTIPTGASAVVLGGSNIYDHAVAVPATSASQTSTAPVATTLQGVIVPSITGDISVRLKPEVAGVVNVARGSFGLVAY